MVAYTKQVRGTYKTLVAYTKQVRGRYRAENDALDLYQVYKGEGSAPDPDTAAVFASSATLPFTTGALTVSKDSYLVVRRQNTYNLQSRNVYESDTEKRASAFFGLDALGNLNAVKPSAPADLAVTAIAAGKVRVTAYYDYLADGANAAAQWLLYVTSNGVDPDPSVDTPTVVDMVKAANWALLSWDSAAYADALTIKVLLRARRVDPGPANVDSASTAILSTTSDTDGPAAPSGGIHQAGKMEHA